MIELTPESTAELLMQHAPVVEVRSALEGRLDGVHLVGGAVRDLLLGRVPSETDLVVEGDAAPVAARLGDALGGEVEFHERFGTATVRSASGTVDLASARAEHYPTGGSLPEVSPATLVEDLRRRDFTANAIAISLEPGSLGSITAADGALADLSAGTLRVLHPASFTDDPTRIWRLARYAARLGFTPEPGTAAAASAAVSDGLLATVSPARHGAELLRSAGAGEPDEGLVLSGQFGLLAHIGAHGFDPALVSRAEDLLGEGVDRAGLRIAACFVGTRDGALLQSLGLPHGIASLALEARSVPERAADLDLAGSPSAIAAVLRDLPLGVIALVGASGPGQKVREWFHELSHIGCPITGEDLLAAGVAPGPLIAVGLAAAFDAALDSGTLSREQALEVALSAIDRVDGP